MRLYYSSFLLLLEFPCTSRVLLYYPLFSLLVFTVFTAGAAARARARVAVSPRELALFTTRALLYCCFTVFFTAGRAAARARVAVAARTRADARAGARRRRGRSTASV